MYPHPHIMLCNLSRNVQLNRNVYELTYTFTMKYKVGIPLHFCGIIIMYWHFVHLCNWERGGGNMISRKLSWTQMAAIAISGGSSGPCDGSLETGEAASCSHAALCGQASYHYHLISIQVVRWRLFRSGQSSSGHGGSRTRPGKIIWTIDPWAILILRANMIWHTMMRLCGHTTHIRCTNIFNGILSPGLQSELW